MLVLADMPQEVPAIAECARDHRVQVIWGLNDLKEQHRKLAEDNPTYNPPTDLDVEAEAAAFDRRNPPEGWAPQGHGRRRSAGNGRRNALAAAPGPARRTGPRPARQYRRPAFPSTSTTRAP